MPEDFEYVVGDEFELGPMEMAPYISKILALGAEAKVKIDGNVLRIVALPTPKESTPAPAPAKASAKAPAEEPPKPAADEAKAPAPEDKPRPPVAKPKFVKDTPAEETK